VVSGPNSKKGKIYKPGVARMFSWAELTKSSIATATMRLIYRRISR
jgi:hypothetical protein